MKYLTGVLCSVFLMIGTAQAITNDVANQFNKLSATEQAQIALDIAQKAENANSVSTTVQDAKEVISVFGELSGVGKAAGHELVAFCRELGIGVTEFMNTGGAFWVILIGVFYYAGSAIVHICFGIFWFSVMIPCWFNVYNRLGLNKKVTSEPAEAFWGIIPRTKKTVEYDDTICNSSESHGWMIVFALFIMIVGIAVTMSF